MLQVLIQTTQLILIYQRNLPLIYRIGSRNKYVRA